MVGQKMLMQCLPNSSRMPTMWADCEMISHHNDSQGCHSHQLFWSSKYEFWAWECPWKTMLAIQQPLRCQHSLLWALRNPGDKQWRWESIPRQVDKKFRVPEDGKGSGALEKEIGVCGPRGEKDKHFFLHWFVLVNITRYRPGGPVSP